MSAAIWLAFRKKGLKASSPKVGAQKNATTHARHSQKSKKRDKIALKVVMVRKADNKV